MGPPRSTPHSARPSRSPSPTTVPHLPLQTLINTPATTTTSTPQQGPVTDLVGSGGPASARSPRASVGSPQSAPHPIQTSPLLQLSTALPPTSSAPVASPTSTVPPSAFRFSPRRQARALSRSIRSFGTTTPPPEQRSLREFGSSSSVDTTGSSSAVHRFGRGRDSYGSLADVPLADLSVASGTSKPSRSATRGGRSDAVVTRRHGGMSDEEEDDEDEQYHHHGGALASGASDADSEGSSRRRSQGEHSQSGPRERLLLPTTELELFHAKKKRTRVLPTAHQSAELNKLLAETPFPSTARREELGRRIGLSARKVQVWFQNRRQKARREKEEAAIKQQSGSTSTSVSGRPESPGLAPLSPRHQHGHPMRMAAMSHPPSAWNPVPPPAPGAAASYAPRSEYTLHSAATPFGHRTPLSSPYQLHPVPLPESVTDYGMVPVNQRRSPKPENWDVPDPRDPLGREPRLSFTRGHQRSSTYAEGGRFTATERAHGRPASPPPSSYHPYTASAEARSRRSPSRRIVQSRPASPRNAQSRPSSPFDAQSVAASEQDVRLPPLNLPPGSPGSPLLGSGEGRRSLDRPPLSPPYPQSISHAASASTSLDRRISDLASRPPQVTAAVRPAEVGQSGTHSTAYPPPFTLQPEPLWNLNAVPDYFQPRRVSWPSQIPLRPSQSSASGASAAQSNRLPWPVFGPPEAPPSEYSSPYGTSITPSRPSSPRPRR